MTGKREYGFILTMITALSLPGNPKFKLSHSLLLPKGMAAWLSTRLM